MTFYFLLFIRLFILLGVFFPMEDFCVKFFCQRFLGKAYLVLFLENEIGGHFMDKFLKRGKTDEIFLTIFYNSDEIIT